jgi:hypothetical protein
MISKKALIVAAIAAVSQEYSQEILPPGTPYLTPVKATFKGSSGTGGRASGPNLSLREKSFGGQPGADLGGIFG